MAKVAKIIKTPKGKKLEIVNPDAAGIDIADSEMQVCVPEDRDGDYNRRFGSFTCDLQEICAWLKVCEIKTIAMEATGVYWLSLFLMLQDNGFDVILVNPHEVKNLSGKKTDEIDAEWLMVLHKHGLLKASYQPDRLARQIRNLCRHRNNLIRMASKETQHMQKAMEQMNIKLTNVLSDIQGKSGRAIIDAILNGNHDPHSLSMLADGRCKKSKEEIAKSLEGTWDDDLLFMLKQSTKAYDFYVEQMKDCDAEIEKLTSTYSDSTENDVESLVRVDKPTKHKTDPKIDIEKYAYGLWGVNTMAIPGMNSKSVMGLIGELGHDFVDKFETASRFCRWCNITPDNKISGGKLLSSKVPKRKNPVGQIFRVAAAALHNSKSELGIYFRRMKSRGGYRQATVATAHKIAKIFYTMIKTKQEYDASKASIDETEILSRKILRMQNALEKLQNRIKKVS